MTTPPTARPTTERRKYNRRQSPEGAPPYYETFDRMAAALEDIATILAGIHEGKIVRLPQD